MTRIRNQDRAPAKGKPKQPTVMQRLAFVLYGAAALGAVLWLALGHGSASAVTTLSFVLGCGLAGRLMDHLTHLRRLAAAAALAYRDELTGLPNRRFFMERLNAGLEGNEPGQVCAVLFLDIDRFKVINDTLGHPAGDRLLVSVSERLSETLGGKAIVSRFGGDEFTMLVEGTSQEKASALAQKILNDLNVPLELNGQQIWPNASIGIALAKSQRPNGDELLRQADIALYEAKQRGRGCYCVYSANDPVSLSSLSLEHELRMAVELGQMTLHYQPVIDLQDHRIAGMEALVRWHHPRLGLLGPADFIPLAEETGLIRPLGEWIITEACSQTRVWQELYGRNFHVSINLSALQFSQLNFLAEFSRVLGETGVGKTNIQVEITETVLMKDEPATVDNLAHLKTMGVKVAIDDFGIGYSSLSYLQKFDVDVLKIDQSFIRDSDNERTLSIIEAMISMAHALGMQVVAEGIENDGQLARLRTVGCDMGQGYLLGRPLAERDMNRLLSAGASVEKLAQLPALQVA